MQPPRPDWIAFGVDESRISASKPRDAAIATALLPMVESHSQRTVILTAHD